MPRVTHHQPGRLLATIVLVVIVGIVPLAGVSAESISPDLQPSLGQQLAQPKVIVNTSFLNVRSGPGAIYSVVGTLPGGVELPVLARNRDASWWQVESPFGIGWVSAEFVIPRGDFRPVPVAQVTGITDQPRVAVIGTPATVYVSPDTSSSVLGLALVASELAVTGKTADGMWWQVETNVGLGWVLQSAVSLRGNGSTVPVVGAQVTAGGLVPAGSAVTYAYGQRPVAYMYAGDVQLVSGPDDGEVVDWLSQGDRVEVLSFSEDGEWALVTYMGNRMAWLRVADVAISDPSDWRTQVIFFRTPNLDLKASPSYAAANTAFIQSPAQLSVLDARNGDGGQWFLLSNASGQGWAPADTVDIIRNGPAYAPMADGQGGGGAALSGAVIQLSGAGVVTTLPQPVRSYVIINTSYLNIRSGPSASFTTVITVSGGTELEADAQTPDGAWLRVSGGFGTGWVNAEFVIFRGDYGNLSIIRYQDATGPTNVPLAIVSAPINVYRGIGIDSGLLGTAPAGLNLQVTGRTLDGSWLRVQTDLGDGWVLTSTVTFQGNVNLVPIVG